MSKALKTTLIVAAALLMVGVLTLSLATAFSGFRYDQIFKDTTWSFPWRVNFGTNNISGYKALSNAFSETGEYSVGTDGLSSIDLKWVAGNVTVSVYDGAEVFFSESSSEVLTQDVALRYGLENGVLFIQYCSTGAPTDLPMKALDVKIPSSLAANMSAFDFSGASATLAISGLTVTDFDCAGVSGRIDATDITAQTVDIDTTSGEVRFTGSYVSLKVNTISGMVRIDSHGAAQETKVNSTSGAMSFAGNVGALNTNTVSGEVYTASAIVASSVDAGTTSGGVSLQFGSNPSVLKIDTISGGIALTLPKNSGFTLEYKTVSGGMNCEFSVIMSGRKYISGDGASQLDLNTVSGGLRIKVAQE